MMNRLNFVVMVSASIVLMLSVTDSLSAQDRTPQKRTGSAVKEASVAAREVALTGSWQPQETASQRSSRLKAIEDATENLGWLMRSKVQEKLRKVTAPKANVKIVDAGDRITLAPVAGPEVTIRTNGKSTKLNVQGRSGTILSVRKNGSLYVKVDGETGTQTTKYTLSKDSSKLTVEVQLSNPKLKRPVRYQATYTRAGARRAGHKPVGTTYR